jgi:hypothetical protein
MCEPIVTRRIKVLQMEKLCNCFQFFSGILYQQVFNIKERTTNPSKFINWDSNQEPVDFKRVDGCVHQFKGSSSRYALRHISNAL